MDLFNWINLQRLREQVPVLLLSGIFGFLSGSHLLPVFRMSESWSEPLFRGMISGLVFYLTVSFLAALLPGSASSSPGPLRALVEQNREFFIAALIVLPVVIFNLEHVFGPAYLLADDPSGYRQGINTVARLWLWNEQFVLNAFTETFSWHLMANYSPFLVRLLYLIFYLSGISLSLYWIARRIFGLNPEEAFPAAVLPAILPLQFQIIAGVNMSYTLLGQLLVLLALISGFCYLTRQEHSWILMLLAGGLFSLATRQMEQAVFVAAAVCFIYLAVSGGIIRKAALIAPVMISSAAVLHRMLTAPRNAAEIQDILLGEIVYRAKTFLLYLSPYLSPVHREYAIPLIALLLLAGTVSFFFLPDLRRRVRELPHFSQLPEQFALLVVPGFVFLWTVPSILPFMLLNRHMDARTMHLSGYGPWLVMAPLLMFVLHKSFSPVGRTAGKRLSVSAIFLLVAVSGIQHMRYAAGVYEKPNHDRHVISRALTYHAFPEGSQIAIIDADTGTHNSYPPCSGYLAGILGNRTDIGGVAGPEFFYYDPFAQADLWRNPMTGLQGTGSLHLFRLADRADHEDCSCQGSLERFGYFLRVISDMSAREEEQQTDDWFLHKLEKGGSFSVIHSGHGLDAYLGLLEKLAKEAISPEQICWGDPGDDFGINSPHRE